MNNSYVIILGNLYVGGYFMEDNNINLKSYFWQSMFHDGVLYPLGSNIAPKFDEDQDLTTGHKYRSRSFGAKDFDAKTVDKTDVKETIEGNFSVYDKKEYDYHWDNETKKSTYMGITSPFEMIDEGKFTSEVSMEDEETIKIITSVDLTRRITGVNYDGRSLRDAMFPNVAHDNLQGNVEIIEYFKVLANGKRLLHYAPSSEFFEVFDLPEGWVLGNGITNFPSPKVFDDVDYDNEDQDLEEMKEILATRKEVKTLKR